MFSFEMSAEIILAKLLSLYIYDTYDTIISHEMILSFVEILDDSMYDLINESRDWLNKISHMFTIIDSDCTSERIYAICKTWALKYGTEEKIGTRTIYTPKDEDQILITLIDHMGLISLGKGRNLRQEIETCSKYMITIRNIYKANITFVQQTNRESKSMDRKLNNHELLGLNDLADSGATAKAAEIVIALYNPFRENISKCQKYNIKSTPTHTGLEDRFRLVQILKNRYGRSDVSIGVAFYGEIGYWKELPKAEDLLDYESWLELDSKNKTEKIKKDKPKINKDEKINIYNIKL